MLVDFENWNPSDPDKLVIQIIRDVQSPKSLESILGKKTVGFIEEISELKTITDIQEKYPEEARDIILWALQKAYKRWIKKEFQRMIQLKRRITYMPAPVLYRHPVYSKENNFEKNTWRYEADMLPAGLMRHIVARNAKETMPCVLPIKNMGVNEYGQPIPLEQHAIEGVEKAGYIICEDKIAWNEKSVAWPIMYKALSKATHMVKYNKRLGAPCVPGGVMFECNFTNTEIWEETSEGPIPSGKDGSGYIHPEHPIFEMINLKQARPLQITALSEDGWFAKGMVFVDADAVNSKGEPTILLDKNMIKGTNKPLVKDLTHGMTLEITAHLGVLRVVNQSINVHWGFEQLENIRLNQRTKEIIHKHMVYNTNQVLDKGLDRFIDQVGESSATMKHLIKICRRLGIDPMQIELIHNKVMKQLDHWHENMCGGANIQSPYLDVCIDNSIPKGHIVVNHPYFIFSDDAHTPQMKALRQQPQLQPWHVSYGEEVVCYRYPTILSQGLCRLVLHPPHRRHRKHWEFNKFTCWMHGDTLKNFMQGDDDGDQIAVDARLDLIELSRNKIDDNVYHVEYESRGNDTDANSPEGRIHMKRKQREHVGLYTNLRSKLLAAGDIAAANAMSLFIQQDVDAPKGGVVWLNYKAAANIRNWKQIGEHEYSFDTPLPPEDLNREGTPDIGPVVGWVKSRVLQSLRKQGVDITEDMANDKDWWKYVTGAWRKDTRSDSMNPLLSIPETLPIWTYNHFVKIFKKYLKERYKIGATDDTMWQKLTKAINDKFHFDLPCVPMEWSVYSKGLRMTAGINTYQKKLANQLNAETEQKDSEDATNIRQFATRRVALKQEELQSHIRELYNAKLLNLKSLLDIWINEWHHEQGKPTAAIAALLWTGSPITALLELTDNNCPSNSHEHTNEVVNWCLAEEDKDPFQKLSQLLVGLSPITTHTYECEYCQKQFTDALVREIRMRQSNPEFQCIRELIPTFKNEG